MLLEPFGLPLRPICYSAASQLPPSHHLTVCICSAPRTSICPPTHPPVCPSTHPATHLPNHPPTQQPTCPTTHPTTQPPTRPPFHPPTRPLTLQVTSERLEAAEVDNAGLKEAQAGLTQDLQMMQQQLNATANDLDSERAQSEC